MGAVYAAADLRLRRPVAVKLLRADLAPDAETSSRFELEARAISTLGHPHIGVLFDFHSAADPVPFLVLELLDGPSLHQAMRQAPRFTLPRALHIALQMLSGVAAAHDAGVIHRDIKPSNVMLVQSGGVPDLVRIVDFGIARMTETITRRHQTSDGQIIGTPAYMSPEQAMGMAAHPGIDVYATALCLYEMLAGQCPFSMGNAVLSLAAVRDLTPPPLRALRPDLPQELSDLVARELSKNPAQRVGNAMRLASMLKRFRAPSGALMVRGPGPGSLAPPATVSTLSAPPPSVAISSTALAPHAGFGVSAPPPAPYPVLAPVPVAVHRTPAWVGGLVGALLVTVLGLLAVVAFFVFPARFGLSVSPSASAGSSAALLPPSSSVSPTSVASSSRPSESAQPPTTPSAAPVPNASLPRADVGASSAATGGKPSCVCIPTFSKEGYTSLCRVRETSSFCRCLMTCAVPMTLDENKNYVCPLGKSLETWADRPGARVGAMCSGFNGTDPTNRKWECNACPGEGLWYAGTEGQPCSGTHNESGNRYDGKLSCGRRSPDR
jgi:serine/threonine protein kinase